MKRQNPVCITHSELTQLRNCAWKHHLKYERMLDPVGGEERTGARSIGGLVHVGIAAVYKTIQQMQLVRVQPTLGMLHTVVRQTIATEVARAGSELDVFVGSEAEEARELERGDQETAARCLDLFVEHIALPRMDRYDVLGVEVPFKVPLLTTAGIRSGDELEGVIDIVLRDRALGTIVCGENKTSSTDASVYELKLATDPQLPLYIYALKQMFGDGLVHGQVLLNVIRKAYPGEPKTNQDGSVSVAECDTTRDIYAAALEMQGYPDWYVKARTAFDAVHDPLHATTTVAPKVIEAMEKAEARWKEVQAKQQTRLAALPTISRFVSQFEEVISEEHVHRAALDAWNGGRLIRMFRRDLLTPWRNGSNCKAFNRLCEFHDACVENIVEPGDLLVKREHRHREVHEAHRAPPIDMMRVMDALGPTDRLT